MLYLQNRGMMRRNYNIFFFLVKKLKYISYIMMATYGVVGGIFTVYIIYLQWIFYEKKLIKVFQLVQLIWAH